MILLPQCLFKLLRLFRLYSVLAVAWSLLTVRCVWFSCRNLAECLRDLALDCIQQEVNVFPSIQAFCIRHYQLDSPMVLLVFLVLIDKPLAVLLIWKQYLGHCKILYCLIEVVQGAEGLSTSAKSLVVYIALFGISIIETIIVFKNSSAVINDFLPHF